jgi:hypothetical protein
VAIPDQSRGPQGGLLILTTTAGGRLSLYILVSGRARLQRPDIEGWQEATRRRLELAASARRDPPGGRRPAALANSLR